MDIQLLSRWFKKGYNSREMATFYLLSEMSGFPETTTHGARTPAAVEQRWAELHDEVCKIIYQK
jgi:hypothetical protein